MIPPISFVRQKSLNFGKKDNYENPVNRSTEKKLAALGSFGKSGAIGTLAGVCSYCILHGSEAKHVPAKVSLISALAALGTLALSMPSSLYDAKVKSFAHEKEMDVFARDKDAQTNILEQVNNEVKDENVPLDKKINDFATVQMAKNGNGALIKGVSS